MNAIMKPSKLYATPLGKMTRKQIRELLVIGQEMSNYCFNMKQSADTPPSMKVHLASLQEEWDAARHEGSQ